MGWTVYAIADRHLAQFCAASLLNPFSRRSSLITCSQVLCGLPWQFLASTSSSLWILLNQLVSSLLSTCPNQRKHLFCITSVISIPKRFLRPGRSRRAIARARLHSRLGLARRAIHRSPLCQFTHEPPVSMLFIPSSPLEVKLKCW